MNKSGYVEKKWHACNPLSIAENSQEIQHDRIFRRDNHTVIFPRDTGRSCHAIKLIVKLPRNLLEIQPQQLRDWPTTK